MELDEGVAAHRVANVPHGENPWSVRWSLPQQVLADRFSFHPAEQCLAASLLSTQDGARSGAAHADGHDPSRFLTQTQEGIVSTSSALSRSNARTCPAPLTESELYPPTVASLLIN